MNKQQTLKQIEELKAKVVELEASVRAESEDKLWEPAPGSIYWYNNGSGLTKSFTHEGWLANDLTIIAHNCYKSREDAEKAEAYLCALRELMAIARHLSGDWVPDWSNDAELKYCIYYNHDGSDPAYEIVACWSDSYTLAIFQTREKAQKAIDMLSDSTKEVLKEGYAG